MIEHRERTMRTRGSTTIAQSTARAPATLTNATRRPARLATAALAALAALGLAAICTPAAAEKSDRDKPIRYSANSLDGNETDGSVILNGKVEINQGTIVLKADRVVLKQQPDGGYNATATGKPVTFRQKMDASDEYVDAQALRIEYLGSKELVELYDQGWIKKGKDELRGNFLTYNSSNGAFAGRGTIAGAPGAATGVDGRVSGVIQPKPKDPATPQVTGQLPAPAGATPAAPLKSAPSIANPPKE